MLHGKLRPRITLIFPLLILSLIAVSLSLIAASAEGGAASSDQAGLEGSSMPDVADVAPPKVDDSISDVELQDLQTVASSLGISLQAAIDRYAWNDNFALAVAGIRETFPEDFAGAEIVDANNAWIAFKGSAPDAALEMMRAFTNSHTAVSVDVRTGMGVSEIEFQRAIEAAHYAVFESSEVRDAVTSHDYATGKITTLVVMEDTASDSVLDDLRVVAEQSVIDATRENTLDSIAISLVKSTRPVIGGVESNTEHLGGELIDTDD
ncbi:MAG: hypothetical protein WD208_08005 [Dehalococcoidia bacterium]